MHAVKALSAFLIVASTFTATNALAVMALRREPPDLRLGQRIRVDDGTCPTGQVKEVTAAKLTGQGVGRKAVCVKR
jgi:hypothetical protein